MVDSSGHSGIFHLVSYPSWYLERKTRGQNGREEDQERGSEDEEHKDGRRGLS